MHFIIGLGNPGKQYEKTRHNAGFLAVDALAQHLNAPPFRAEKKFNALVTHADYNQETCLLVKPQTYMNRSGMSVSKTLAYYQALPKHLALFAKKDADLTGVLTVIHDDVDFDLGAFKIQTNRNAGGHNGVASIITHLKTKNFRRVRVGINGARNERMPTDKFVLEQFSPDELDRLAAAWPQLITQLLAAL